MDPEAEQGLSELTDRLAQVEPRLDELARERLLARIHAELEVDARSPRRARVSGYVLAALVASAALALMVWIGVEPRASEPVAHTGGAVEAPQRKTTAPAATLQLVPYLFSGGSAARADALLGLPQTRIELASGERLLAALGGHARLALVGPAALHVQKAQGARFELELDEGVLLGDYDHTRAGALIIHSPGAQTEVVGTLFSVRARGRESQVGVARGKVRVRAGAQRIDVGVGEAWSAGSPATEALSEAAAAELAQHERSLRPTPGAHGVLGITGEQLEAELAERWLGPTPLWAIVPVGSNTIALRDLRDREREARSLQATVRSAERTELVVGAGSGEQALRFRAAGSDSPGTQRAPERRTQEHSAAALYAAAERALREGKLEQGSELLERMLATFPAARNRDLALYDLALAAYRQNDFGRTSAVLDRLEREPPRPALRELAAYLRCRTVHARAPADAPACFERFRRSFPNSPHAQEVWEPDGAVRTR
jgi:ferric-dicitrate binding protein FerR (iron transport regulator)